VKLFSIASVLILSAALTACGTTMPTGQSGFLSSYAGLATGNDPAAQRLQAQVGIDPSRIQFGEISMQPGAAPDLSVEERERLTAYLRLQLRQRVADLPQNPGGQAAVIRAAITRVETVSPALNTVSTLLLLAPLDRGGAAFEMEAVDAASGAQLAALKLGHYAPITDLLARFSKFEPTEIATRKAAQDFVALLAQPGTVPVAK
jgi:Protein of unknown function (DUF3313)